MAEESKIQKWNYPLLESKDDFAIYRARLVGHLRLCGVGRFAQEQTPPPANEAEAGLAQKAADILLQTLGENCTRVVLRHYPNPVMMRQALSEDLASKRTANCQSVETQLLTMRYYMAKETMPAFFERLEKVRLKYQALGGDMNDNLLTNRLLDTFEYNAELAPAVASMRTLDNIGFERLKARMLDEYSRYERRGGTRNAGNKKRKRDGDKSEERILKKVKTLIASAGGKGNRKGQKNGLKKPKDLSKLVCWNCGKTGHYRSQCPEGKKENANSAVIDSGATQNIVQGGNKAQDSEYMVSVEWWTVLPPKEV